MDDMGTVLNQSNMTLSELNHQQMLVRIPAIIYTAIMMVIGIVGNAITCYVYGFRLPLNANNCFIVVLASYDFLTSCFIMPFIMVKLLYPVMFPSETACKIMIYGEFFTTVASSLILFVIAFNRYRRVCRPLSFQISVRVAKATSFALTCVVIVMAIPVLNVYEYSTRTTRIASMNGTYCSLKDGKKSGYTVPLFYGGLMAALVFLVVGMSICYLLIWKEIRHRVSRSKGGSWGCFYFSSSKIDSSTADDQDDAANRYFPKQADDYDMKKMMRMNMTMLLVMVVFFLSYVPCLTILTVRRVLMKLRNSLDSPIEMMYHLGVISWFFSSTLNPFIYGYRNQDFREEIEKMFSGVFLRFKK